MSKNLQRKTKSVTQFKHSSMKFHILRVINLYPANKIAE